MRYPLVWFGCLVGLAAAVDGNALGVALGCSALLAAALWQEYEE